MRKGALSPGSEHRARAPSTHLQGEGGPLVPWQLATPTPTRRFHPRRLFVCPLRIASAIRPGPPLVLTVRQDLQRRSQVVCQIRLPVGALPRVVHVIALDAHPRSVPAGDRAL